MAANMVRDMYGGYCGTTGALPATCARRRLSYRGLANNTTNTSNATAAPTTSKV